MNNYCVLIETVTRDPYWVVTQAENYHASLDGTLHFVSDGDETMRVSAGNWILVQKFVADTIPITIRKLNLEDED